jgi:hypothetical protein
MPSLHSDLIDGLPVVRIIARQRQGENYVKTPELVAAIDIGASDLIVARGILHQNLFLLAPGGYLKTGSAAAEGFWGCDAEVTILNAGEELAWVPVKALEASIPFPGCQAALGNSFLRRCVFLYDGIHGKFTLAW